ncbi:unnamed protein product [Zymoseptoria tritici ST99CH_1A5]|uniref:non-specific serine/threonine protein kinase n=1 Tax=Zymoseptoria tritici ST99CH_1A5 TaxID=1276529 RepID=A0A1Y6LXW3_ZYMTR|nr:unnamed protein product [Zymoseptoria tritici ST99CH_1A5]
MGQGYSAVTLPAGPSAIETSELTDLTYEKTLGGARFLRTVRAKHSSGIVVAKVITKSNPSVSFKRYSALLREERQKLRGIPNVLPYARIRETAAFGLLVRQFVHTSLYDRVSIRPFLEGVEKKWIAFQLLCAVRDCHAQGVFHGDIKSENVLVTSWGWVYLTDFASQFKPVYLPEDNPADFSFYYDASARRTCYLAPERFLAAGEKPREGNVVQWNMDIFSLGCVLAELFTESPTFTLSQLYRYRKGEYDPTVTLLNKVDDEHVRSLISSMIRLDPTERWHANDYLDEYKEKVFPFYFYNHLHTLMQEITDPMTGRKSGQTADKNNGISDERIDRIYNDFEILSVSLGYQDAATAEESAQSNPALRTGLFPMQVDLPNSRHTVQSAHHLTSENGTFVLLNVIASAMRTCARAASKVRACELLLAFAERLPDEGKLDRVLPYIIPLLEDPNDMVLVAALRTMTQILAMVTVVSPVNSFLFTQYIFPKLQVFVKSTTFRKYSLVRATYAACLASLAETASRFLDAMQALKAEGSLPSAERGGDTDEDYTVDPEAYDATRLEMLEQFEGQTKVFLTDTDTAVRRAFLTSVSSLCVFFGEARASDIILSHLNTYLNDPDWLLKRDFFKTIVGVAVYIGSANLEEYILPLMLQALTDPQELVVEQALRSMASMAEMGLLQRSKIWELIDTVARFQMHPNFWIKEAACHLISATTTYLSMADVRILVAPLIQPYLKVPIGSLTESELLDALKKPLPRAVLDLAVQWAVRVEKSVFWKPARESKQLSSPGVAQMPPQSSVAGLSSKSFAKVPKTDEDEQWLGRLRNAGMTTEDEMKLLAFREYIWRSAQRSKRDDGNGQDGRYEQMISLSALKITPQTVIFENSLEAYEQHSQRQEEERTIVEAIEEASTVDARKKPDEEGGLGVRSADSGATAGMPIDQRRVSGLRSKNSGSLSSSPSSGIGLLGRDVDRALRQKGAAAGLLGGADLRVKAQAEVATDDTTATGRLNSPHPASRKPSPSPNADSRPSTARTVSHRSVHNYAGNDPTVLKLLDAVYVDTFPIDAADFGPVVQLKSGLIPTNSNQPNTGPWRPQGQLIAVLGEHTAKVTRILPAPSHLFFLTASDDGTVKVWDTARLERNITHRSRQTYRLPSGVKVTSLCFVEGTHSFICTGSDGSIHAIRVDVTESSSTTRYGKLRTIKTWNIPPLSTSSSSAPEHALWSEHFLASPTSTLLITTSANRILAFSLKHTSLLYSLRVPSPHGSPSTFCISRRKDWLLVGTTTGVLHLWDLRFHVRLRSWSFANPAPITRLQLHPSRKSSRRNMFCMTGGTAVGEVSVWSLEKGVCFEVYRGAHGEGRERVDLREYELRNLEDEKGDKPLARAMEREGEVQMGRAAFAVFGAQTSVKDPDVQSAFLVAGGPDGKVRFWDCERLEGCSVISGNEGDQQPTYQFSQLSLDTRVCTERNADATTGGGGGGVESSPVGGGGKGRAAAGSGSGDKGKTPSRYEVIRTSARNLMRRHLDLVTGVAVVERPVGMVVSADRGGMVFVHL